MFLDGKKRLPALCLVVVALASLTAPATVSLDARPAVRAPADATLPTRLSDADYWKLVTDISEPGGFFRITDNYTSNEPEIGRIFKMLQDRGVRGGVYVGVGPEQNLTYMAAIRPAMAFIIDIRRQAVMQHLVYKAVFELASDRAEFLSLLFARPRPTDLTDSTPIQKMWDAYIPVPVSTELAMRTHARLIDRITRTHGFTLSADEREQFDTVVDAFVEFGPGISTRGRSGGGGGGNSATFVDLTGWSLDAEGEPRSFLSSEDNYRFVKNLHVQNLIVPVSGDFGGSQALRAIGDYVRAQNATVSAFYLSNVEQYLFQDGKDRAFYANVATLPTDAASVFIRPYSLRRGFGPAQPLCPIRGFIQAVMDNKVRSNNDALACAQ